MESAPKTLAKIRVQKITPQGLSTHFWRREAPPEMGGAPLLRYFLDAYFSKGFGGVFHAFLQIVFISSSPLYWIGYFHVVVVLSCKHVTRILSRLAQVKRVRYEGEPKRARVSPTGTPNPKG